MNTVESLKAISTEFESLNTFWENTVETHEVVIDRSAIKNIDAEIEEISENIREYAVIHSLKYVSDPSITYW